jgi:co-chaperonin GroES (HSP10)
MNTEKAPRIVGVKPTNSQILIELLTAQEMMDTTFIIPGETNIKSPPQAYVLDFGPSLDSRAAGIKIGDRVLLQGSYVPIPDFDNNRRPRGLVELHGVKAVLVEG